jgi:hemerythrin-like domain-containing protein
MYGMRSRSKRIFVAAGSRSSDCLRQNLAHRILPMDMFLHNEESVSSSWARGTRQMGIQIGAKPDSGFDDPLGMLKDCHRRIEHFLGILCHVAEHAQNRAMTGEETAAVRAALSYFQTGGQRHTADEEESLFPRLVSAGGFAELDRLEHDHAEAGQLHSEVETLYSAWIASGSLDESESCRLLSATSRLRGLYQAHIEVEDHVVFPKAAQLLDKDAIAAIGREFRIRRQ